MKNQLAGIAVALCIATVSAAAAETPSTTESVMTMRVDGELAIDPQGKVLDYRIDTKLEPAMRAQIDKAIPRWLFLPVSIDGKATAVKSRMRITLAAQQVAAGYAVSIDNVVFQDDRATTAMQLMGADAKPVDDISSKSRRPPGYPLGLMRAGVEGAVLLYIRVTPDGRAGDVAAVQSALFNVRGRDKTLAEALRLLENNTVAAAKQWRFNVPAGRASLVPELMTVAVPVHYTMDRKSADVPGQWRVEVRGLRQSASWLTEARLAQAVGVSDLASGEMMPLDSRMHLREGSLGNKAL